MPKGKGSQGKAQAKGGSDSKESSAPKQSKGGTSVKACLYFQCLNIMLIYNLKLLRIFVLLFSLPNNFIIYTFKYCGSTFCIINYIWP